MLVSTWGTYWRALAAGAMALAVLGLGVARAEKPEQVIVSVKIIEFQATKGVETGLSAFLSKVSRPEPFGEVSTVDRGVTSLDLTFPTSSTRGITVFLDRISFNDFELELVIQALVDESRAFILSRPHAMVKVGEETPTRVETSQDIPFESTRVVGSTAVQITEFQTTGVVLNLNVPEIIDDDNDWDTVDDTYIRLNVDASVREEGSRIVVALDDQLAGGRDGFGEGTHAITVPQFVSRAIKTEVWVRHGQVLILGGLFRNIETKSIATVPFFPQAEEALVGTAERVLSRSINAAPLTGTVGNRRLDDTRRELIFLIKAEAWRPSLTISDDLGFAPSEPDDRRGPVDIITSVGQGVVNIFTGRDDYEEMDAAEDQEAESADDPPGETEETESP